ncbi:conserved hypothetical protein [Theileria equi strain WA]|uniref:Signal peptide containing protein n=1 Tax=Theileria equi strain WA TaxID=1537102 RepID=L1LAP4_THEEQ|nr:conserved hypothetical protein [Theileria equi strain WA]EKX72391.1 conserved hypothetical protein [Theileria equi strain WA]|eukprot:XP_004831843.1 conserved hypothetical protein [Theileria equi strain WA]
MNVIALFLLIQTVLQACASPVNLDVGSTNHPDFFLETEQECTLTRSVYRPKRGRAEVRVSHRGGLLWSTGEKDECVNVQVFSRDKLPLFLHIVFTRNDVLEDAYYVYKKKWEMCNENAFKEALERERIQTLKIDSPNPLLGTLQRNDTLIGEETFVSDDKCSIGKVEHNGKTLWEGRRGDSFLSYMLISENGKASLLNLMYKRDGKQFELYYHYSGDWIAYTGEYRDAFDKREKNILEINFPNSLLGNLTKYGDPAYEAIFISNNEFRITKLRDNGITIWEAKEGECFIYSKQFLDNGKATLLQLVSTSSKYFYELSDGTWKKITKKEFEQQSMVKMAIDVGNRKNGAYKVFEHQFLNVPATKFTSNTNTRLVYDSGRLVYKVRSGFKLNKVTLYNTGTHILMDINYTEFDEENHAHFIKTNGLWKTILGTDFDKILQRVTTPIIPNQISLDIRIPDERICRIENTGDPVCERVIIPKNEYRVTKVTDGKNTIWEASGDKHILKATVYLENGQPVLLTLKHSNVERNYKFSNGSWSKVSCNCTFNRKVKGLKGRVASKVMDERKTIDVNKRESTFYSCSEYIECGIPTVSFTPREKVMAIKDGHNIIHRFEKEVENPTIRLHVAKYLKLLAVSYLQHNRFKSNATINLHFENVHGIWRSIDHDRFTELFRDASEKLIADALEKDTENTLANSRKGSKSLERSHYKDCTLAPPGNILDIMASIVTGMFMDGDRLDLKDPFVKVTPKEDQKLTEINESGQCIWRASEEEKCIAVWIDYKNNNAKLIDILLFYTDELHKYFEKLDGSWKEIDEEEYKLLQSLQDKDP